MAPVSTATIVGAISPPLKDTWSNLVTDHDHVLVALLSLPEQQSEQVAEQYSSASVRARNGENTVREWHMRTSHDLQCLDVNSAAISSLCASKCHQFQDFWLSARCGGGCTTVEPRIIPLLVEENLIPWAATRC